jgi:hypothetical protein
MPTRDTVEDLLRKCVEARMKGADFPTVWQTILKGHPLTAGVPVSRVEGGQPVLAVPLITRQQLEYRTDGYSIA